MPHNIVRELTDPKSIVVVGGSNNIHKPGGKIVMNILEGTFKGKLYVLNPKEKEVQGVASYHSITKLPVAEMAILAIPAKACIDVIEELSHKGTKAFIVISSGFSETGKAGAEMEQRMVKLVQAVQGSLIGPNCIGIINSNYQAVFTNPIPKLSVEGCDLISGSGATSVFIMESGRPKGLPFASVYSIGNSAMIGVEDMLEYLDESYDEKISSKIKLLYIESIVDPDKLLRHASSLIRKGCRIAAIKAGGSDPGGRAASSHTGALASSDLAVEALFRKAGIVRCYGREELTTVASIFMHKELKGKNIAIITHAGGPAVMLTDALASGGMEIPEISGSSASYLLSKLNPGASVSNPIDILATGTAEQLKLTIDFCESRFDEIDAMMVIFGSTGLSTVFDAYEVLHEMIKKCSKPIYSILPSISTAKHELDNFLKKGHINFPDEVVLGNALTRVYHTPEPAEENIFLDDVHIPEIRKIIENAETGYLQESKIQLLLDAAGIPRVTGKLAQNRNSLLRIALETGYPLVMKISGPVHKTDVGGVTLNIKSKPHLLAEYNRMKRIPGYQGVLIQPMLSGMELFLGAKYEKSFGHVIICGLGGIFVEVIKDISSGLAPLTLNEALSMIRSLKSYKIMLGARGKAGINEMVFAKIMMRLSSLLRFATEIKEMDLNPLIGIGHEIFVVDARIWVEK